MTGIACLIMGHNYDEGTFGGKTGRLCFSIDCARPEILINYECQRCGKVKSRHYMSGLPSNIIEMTPAVAAQCLRDMK